MSAQIELWQGIAQRITEHTDETFEPQSPVHVGGGCINTALKLSDGRRDYFVKLNSARLADMFVAEAEGLRTLAASHSIRVPEPVCHGTLDAQAYLVMEHIRMGGAGRNSAETAGSQLAAMHRHTRKDFGWHRDNTIGSTHQPNKPHDDWIGFWRERRLGFQLRLAASNGHGGSLQSNGEKLLDGLPALLVHTPEPSLLHGDLWGGNLSYGPDGEPVIFDPAVYYGDREAELAMTELFGGFPRHFYAAYNEAWPLEEGYRVRKGLYNLYHILNHLNMFGGGYLGQAQDMIERLLAEFV